ncbi:hypothetical protein ABID21_003658 [Pseudorhizobium tarimense]|uniref:Uncharacterized protein n=1 Tax=Pseudorhizobium tarimense TaxID=1079109 RepID=A0ABV2HAI4_9HYPH
MTAFAAAPGIMHRQIRVPRRSSCDLRRRRGRSPISGRDGGVRARTRPREPEQLRSRLPRRQATRGNPVGSKRRRTFSFLLRLLDMNAAANSRLHSPCLWPARGRFCGSIVLNDWHLNRWQQPTSTTSPECSSPWTVLTAAMEQVIRSATEGVYFVRFDGNEVTLPLELVTVGEMIERTEDAPPHSAHRPTRLGPLHHERMAVPAPSPASVRHQTEAAGRIPPPERKAR